MTVSAHDVLPRVSAIVAEIAEIPQADVRPTDALREGLGLDSLGLVELLTALHDRLGVLVPDEQADELFTVDDVVARVLKEV
ncbi:acyl carrier protein [Streptomyces sp. NPDC050504]|uniref:acyl carrier protein n=1 Tax=Streptomyces sp. NPDC050504 TaxID=3365618 RepID=UPI003793124B